MVTAPLPSADSSTSSSSSITSATFPSPSSRTAAAMVWMVPVRPSSEVSVRTPRPVCQPEVWVVTALPVEPDEPLMLPGRLPPRQPASSTAAAAAQLRRACCLCVIRDTLPFISLGAVCPALRGFMHGSPLRHLRCHLSHRERLSPAGRRNVFVRVPFRRKVCYTDLAALPADIVRKGGVAQWSLFLLLRCLSQQM